MKHLLLALSLILFPKQTLAMSCGLVLDEPPKLNQSAASPIIDQLVSEILEADGTKELKSIQAIPELKGLLESVFGNILKDTFSSKLSSSDFYNLLVRRKASLLNTQERLEKLIEMYDETTLFPADPALIAQLRKLHHSLGPYVAEIRGHIKSIDEKGPDLPAPQIGFDLVWQRNLRTMTFFSLSILLSGDFHALDTFTDHHSRPGTIQHYYSSALSQDVYFVRRPSQDGVLEKQIARRHLDNFHRALGRKLEAKAPIFIFFEEPHQDRKNDLEKLNARFLVFRSLFVGP